MNSMQMPNAGRETRNGKPTRADWARIWFEKLSKFHRINDPQRWKFTEQDVIEFLRSKLKAGVPAWKRLKIVQNLIDYRNQVLRSKAPPLEPIRAKLQQLVIDEQSSHETEPLIEERIGKINPNEPDVIQQMRRTIRVRDRRPNTEKAYMKWVKRFMKVRGLKTMADFEGLGAADVESFLTDLAVDGDVAASTQSQAFYGLLFLFEQVLKRDIRGINALRAKKPKLVPTVMSELEVGRVLTHLVGFYLLIAQLLYGCGMRISECLRLRVMDLDFDLMQIRIYNSKGEKQTTRPDGLPASSARIAEPNSRSQTPQHRGGLAA